MTDVTAIFGHILVPTDGSQPSIAAGRLAIRLAAAQGARITFTYVVDAVTVERLGTVSNKASQQITSELERTGQHYLNYLARLARDAGVQADLVIRHGMPCAEIETLAREIGADLIVMGQVGQHGPRRVLIGSVTERMIERAPCPVLVVK